MPEPRDEQVEKPWATTGHKHKRPHNVVNSLYLTADELERLNVERYERYAVIERDEQRAETFLVEDADVVVVAFGASARVARSAVVEARAKGVKAGLIRPITLWPFPVDGARGRGAHRQGLPHRGDEHGPDGGRRAAWP